jgi:hypothetical protein
MKPIVAAAHLFPGHVEPKPLRKKCRAPRATVVPPPTVLAGLLWKIGNSPLAIDTDRPPDWWASKPFQITPAAPKQRRGKSQSAD